IATVIVSVPRISIALDSTTIGLTRTINGTLTLSAPAPVGGTSVSLSSTPGGIVTLPQAVNVAGGASTATFTVTGSAVGSTNIVGSAPGYISGSELVNVNAL